MLTFISMLLNASKCLPFQFAGQNQAESDIQKTMLPNVSLLLFLNKVKMRHFNITSSLELTINIMFCTKLLSPCLTKKTSNFLITSAATVRIEFQRDIARQKIFSFVMIAVLIIIKPSLWLPMICNPSIRQTHWESVRIIIRRQIFSVQSARSIYANSALKKASIIKIMSTLSSRQLIITRKLDKISKFYPESTSKKLKLCFSTCRLKRKVKQYLIAKHQQLLDQLDQIAEQKLQTLISCQVQLKMLNDKIQWAKAFAKFQDKSLKPIQYFHSQIMFQQDLVKLKIAQFQPIFSVKANIQTEGDIKVGTRDTLQSYRIKKSITNNTYFSPKKEQSEYEKVRNESLLKRLADQQSLLQYNKNSIMPKKGDLSLLIENSNFKFFQISAK